MAMVHYRSEDGVFDAPVDKVWKLIQAHDAQNISRIHPDFLSTKTVEEKGNVMVKEFRVQTPRGVDTLRIRFTVNPPTASRMEWLTGPMAGSWCNNTYKAEGSRTRVVTEGEFKMAGMDEASTRKMVGAFMDKSFEEDARFLRTLK